MEKRGGEPFDLTDGGMSLISSYHTKTLPSKTQAVLKYKKERAATYGSLFLSLEIAAEAIQKALVLQIAVYRTKDLMGWSCPRILHILRLH